MVDPEQVPSSMVFLRNWCSLLRLDPCFFWCPPWWSKSVDDFLDLTTSSEWWLRLVQKLHCSWSAFHCYAFWSCVAAWLFSWAQHTFNVGGRVTFGHISPWRVGRSSTGRLWTRWELWVDSKPTLRGTGFEKRVTPRGKGSQVRDLRVMGVVLLTSRLSM